MFWMYVCRRRDVNIILPSSCHHPISHYLLRMLSFLQFVFSTTFPNNRKLSLLTSSWFHLSDLHDCLCISALLLVMLWPCNRIWEANSSALSCQGALAPSEPCLCSHKHCKHCFSHSVDTVTGMLLDCFYTLLVLGIWINRHFHINSANPWA